MDNTRRKEKEGEAKKEVRIFTKAEVAKHDTVNDCWMIINGKVYDVTPFVDEHPGGDILMDGAGKDASDMFDDVGHSGAAIEYLKDFYIGQLAKE
ncbi:cytochrome b5, putative [Acanthamoeba castellanii str. Neff]|uniref:Cytochrome b5, putative n=1 Tax=Acanthamoeba castellanii (strain ATCC 30010 / Neff) TaxID=1257118 RepID=L8GMH5_ACACF|nr:cytochrome b5, putative [Acanthamoeba castellanii str. Neff]ELR13958.1 cytochrome b5, putative [Acanthamoeba castellanii str. Neff]